VHLHNHHGYHNNPILSIEERGRGKREKRMDVGEKEREWKREIYGSRRERENERERFRERESGRERREDKEEKNRKR
jgi:hypothetical protein